MNKKAKDGLGRPDMRTPSVGRTWENEGVGRFLLFLLLIAKNVLKVVLIVTLTCNVVHKTSHAYEIDFSFQNLIVSSQSCLFSKGTLPIVNSFYKKVANFLRLHTKQPSPSLLPFFKFSGLANIILTPTD